MAETLINPEVFETVCLAEEDREQGRPQDGYARVAAAFEGLIFKGYSFREAIDAFRAADQELQYLQAELDRGIDG